MQKLGEKKALTSRNSKLLKECSQIIWGFRPFIHPKFVITDFRW